MPGMHRRPVGPGPGGPQGSISASLLLSSVPWALPGAQKHVTRHNPPTAVSGGPKKACRWSHSHLKSSLSRVQLFVIPWNSPGQNTGVGSHSLLQVIFPTQGSNPGLPHCRRNLYQLRHREDLSFCGAQATCPGSSPQPGGPHLDSQPLSGWIILALPSFSTVHPHDSVQRPAGHCLKQHSDPHSHAPGLSPETEAAELTEAQGLAQGPSLLLIRRSGGLLSVSESLLKEQGARPLPALASPLD